MTSINLHIQQLTNEVYISDKNTQIFVFLLCNKSRDCLVALCHKYLLSSIFKSIFSKARTLLSKYLLKLLTTIFRDIPILIVLVKIFWDAGSIFIANTFSPYGYTLVTSKYQTIEEAKIRLIWQYKYETIPLAGTQPLHTAQSNSMASSILGFGKECTYHPWVKSLNSNPAQVA